MKNGRLKVFLGYRLLCLILLAGLPVSIFSQCLPDTINCIDVDSPGQICPRVLPEGRVGVAYEETITVLAPDSAFISGAMVELVKITLDNIENLPVGIDYSAEITEYYPNQAYCVSVQGTPQEAGTYYLRISVTPYIFFLSVIPLPVQIDSTSVFLKINPSTSIDPTIHTDFSLIQAFPNPFEESTRIGFRVSDPGKAELLIYNMLGKQIHREVIMFSGGNNYFEYSGVGLNPGCYFYNVSRNGKFLSGRFVKSR